MVMSKADIISKWQQAHDDLERAYYVRQEMSKGTFDAAHGQLWDDCHAELVAAGHITEKPPPRDLAAELDALTVRVGQLESAKQAQP